jgi:hypothetical protein
MLEQLVLTPATTPSRHFCAEKKSRQHSHLMAIDGIAAFVIYLVHKRHARTGDWAAIGSRRGIVRHSQYSPT